MTYKKAGLWTLFAIASAMLPVSAKAADLGLYESCLYEAAGQDSEEEDPYEFTEYTLGDMNGDGIPECFVNAHSGKHGGTLYVYTIEGGDVVCLGEFEADIMSGESLLLYQNGILEYYSYKGDESLIWHCFDSDGSDQSEVLYDSYDENWRENESEPIDIGDFVDMSQVVESQPMIPVSDLSYLYGENVDDELPEDMDQAFDDDAEAAEGDPAGDDSWDEAGEADAEEDDWDEFADSDFESEDNWDEFADSDFESDDDWEEEEADENWDEFEGVADAEETSIDRRKIFISSNETTSDISWGTYLIPDSDIRYLDRSDLAEFSDKGLRLARNEIYARHGRIFKNKAIREYFESCGWYAGTIEPKNFKNSLLNKYEKKNIKLIKKVEKERKKKKKGGYSDEEIVKMAEYYYHQIEGKTYLRVEVEYTEPDWVQLHIYEIKDNHTATTAWLTIDRKTGIGTDLLGEEFDLITAASGYSSGYILPDSDSRYLEKFELKGLSNEELRIARNEIYARRGRRFKDKKLQAYFDGCSWYRGTIEPDAFNEDVLNKYEKKNAELIAEVEGR